MGTFLCTMPDTAPHDFRLYCNIWSVTVRIRKLAGYVQNYGRNVRRGRTKGSVRLRMRISNEEHKLALKVVSVILGRNINYHIHLIFPRESPSCPPHKPAVKTLHVCRQPGLRDHTQKQMVDLLIIHPLVHPSSVPVLFLNIPVCDLLPCRW